MAIDDPNTCAYKGKGGAEIICPIKEVASFCVKGERDGCVMGEVECATEWVGDDGER